MNAKHAQSRTIRRRVLAIAVACCFPPALAWGNPVGPVVTHGQASFSTAGKVLTVTNSPGSIINWQSFSIGAGETTRFVQQNAASAVLNRVMGGQTSSILGTLQSNGRVFLVNPNGIIFGAGAQINTAGLIASTLNIMDADFLTGKMRFVDTPNAKAITNAGEIRTPAGGRVMLIAPEGVSNEGLISAPGGEVILAAGRTVELADSANPEVRVAVSAPDAKAVNLGRIVAESGRIGIYGGIVSNRGVVNANSAVVGENGRIVFRAARDATLEAGSVTTANGPTGGSIEASSGGTTLVAGDVQARGSAGAGGDVKILGDRVGVIGTASIDASGDLGGGTVLVGGDLQGANAAVQNATSTFLGADTRIRADAVTAGDGGKVIAWANDTLRSYGAISARGGSASGNGGFVETSGALGLDVRTGPDVRAPAGRPGTWLLDPYDLSVVDGAELDLAINSGSPFFAPLADNSRIGAQVINAQLDFGSNVTLTTKSAGGGTQAGNITISAPIAKTASGDNIGTTTLTLQADNDIVITSTGSITSTGDPLNVVMRGTQSSYAGGAITIGGGGIQTNGGYVEAYATGAVNVNAPINAHGPFAGSVYLTSSTGSINVNSAISTVPQQSGFGGYLSLSAHVGALNIAAPLSTGTLSASAGGNVGIAGPVSTQNNAYISSSNGSISIAANLTSGSGTDLSARNGIRITNGAQVTAGPFSSFYANVYGAGGSFDVDAGSAVSAGYVSLYADSMEIAGPVQSAPSYGETRINTASSGRAMDIGSNAAGALGLTQAEINQLQSSPTLYFGASGPLTVSAPLALTGTQSASLSTSSTLTVAPGANVSGSGPLSMSASGAITLNASLSAGTLDIGSNTSITQAAGASASATGYVDIYAPAISLGGTVSGNGVDLRANSLTVGSTVTSAGDIGLRTYNYVPVNLGVATKGTGSLDLTAAELNRFAPASGTGALYIGSTNNNLLTIQGPIAPTGAQTLVLGSGNGISQAAGATITVPALGISAYGNVTLPEANGVGMLAANLYSTNAALVFANAPGLPLDVGSVAQQNVYAVTVYGSNSSVNLGADQMNVSTYIDAGGSVTIRPVSPAVKIDLGGADVAGSVLGLSAMDVANVYAPKLIVKADQVDVSAPVSVGFGTGALNIAPLTQAAGPAPRGMAIVSTKTGGSDVELTSADIGNVTAGELVLGDAATGRIAVLAPLTVPGTIGKLAFNTGDQAIGVAVNAPISATADLAFLTDTLTLSALTETSSGSITIAPRTAARAIEIGSRPPGKLALSAFEATSLLAAPNGTLTFGSSGTGNIDITAPLDLAASNPPAFRDLALVSGGVITVNAGAGPSSVDVTAPGAITMNAPQIVLNTPVRSLDTGGITLTADRLTVGAQVEARNPGSNVGAGEIRIQPRTARQITIGTDDSGSNLGLTPTEMANLSAETLVRIGDAVNTRSILINEPNAVVIAPATPSLSLIGGPFNVTNNITQSGQGTLSVASLAASARNNITLDLNNDIDVIAARSNFGSVNVTYSGSNPLTVGTVDGISGITANNGTVRLRTDEITISESIFAGSSGVTLMPLNANRPIYLGIKSSGDFSLSPAEMDRVFATTLTIGDTANTSDITVNAAIAPIGISNLALHTQPGRTISVVDTLTVPGTATINTGTLNVPGAIQAGAVAVTADALTINGSIASAGTISLQPRQTGLPIAFGGADSAGQALGLDATDLGHLSWGNELAITNGATGSVDFTYAGPALPGNVRVSTGTATFNNSTMATTGAFTLSANTVTLPGGSSISGGGGVTVGPTTATRSVVLGTKPGGGTELALDVAELGRISTGAGTLLKIATQGAMTTTAALDFTTTVGHVELNAGSLTHSGGTLTSPGDLTLRANTMVLSSDATSTGAGRILVAPHPSFSSRTINLGTNTGGTSTLDLDAAELSRLVTAGVVQIGDTSRTSSLSVTQPVSQPSGSSALMLAANGSISQSAGAAITANNLRIQSNGSVNLPEANAVGTLAGSSSGSFSFSNGIPLAIGVVDNQTGIVDSTITLRADQLSIAAAIAGSSVTLAPATAGAPITLGTKVAGQFSLTDAEMDFVTGSTTLNIGTNATNPSGNITVTAPIERPFGNLALITNPGSSITVNAGASVGSTAMNNVTFNAGSTGTVTLNGPVDTNGNVTITGGTVNIAANVGSLSTNNITINAGTGNVNVGGALTTSGDVSINAGNIATSQQITANDDVFLSTSATLTGSVTVGGSIVAADDISITARTIAINAPIVASGGGSQVSLTAPSGATGSSVTINSPITSGNFIGITTDSIAINAPLVTTGSSMSLVPRTAGTPIILGDDTSGGTAFALSASEIALLSSEFLSIGTSNAGPITISTPITSSSIIELTLQSGGDIVQTASAPITLSYTDSNGQPGAGLTVLSTGGKVDLSAANDVNNSINGSAGGSGQNFVFTNLSPLKLQNVSPELALAPTPGGRAVLSVPIPGITPTPTAPKIEEVIAAQAAVTAVLQASETQEDADKKAEANKEEGEKKDREERKKEGKKSCS